MKKSEYSKIILTIQSNPTQPMQHVKKLVSLARTNNLCLIPFGGGTSVTHSVWCPPKSQEPRPIVSVDMRKMNKILWVNREVRSQRVKRASHKLGYRREYEPLLTPSHLLRSAQDGLACIEAGIVGRDLVDGLEGGYGLTMGHEPDSIEFSTLGGWVATKASGMKRNKYGNIEDIVSEVTLVGGGEGNPDLSQSIVGRVSCGMELKDTILGSEGNFGIITSAVVKVSPLPEVVLYDR